MHNIAPGSPGKHLPDKALGAHIQEGLGFVQRIQMKHPTREHLTPATCSKPYPLARHRRAGHFHTKFNHRLHSFFLSYAAQTRSAVLCYLKSPCCQLVPPARGTFLVVLMKVHCFLKLCIPNHLLSSYSPVPLLPERTPKAGPGIAPSPPLSLGVRREAGCPAQMHGALLYPSEGQCSPTLPSGVFPPPRKCFPKQLPA